MSPIKKLKRKLEEYSEVMRHEKVTTNFFKSFITKPKNIKLNIQDKDERIILVIRQHLITQVRELFSLVIATIFIPWLLYLSGFLPSLPMRFQVAFYLGFIIVAIGMLLRAFLIWFFNVYIITDERVIDVDFHSMIYKNVSSAKLENIEDVTARTVGPLAAIFDYGTILIQTAGAKTEFEFDHVPQPSKIKKLLNELILEEEREKLEGRVN